MSSTTHNHDGWNRLNRHYDAYTQEPQPGVLANVQQIKKALDRFLSSLPVGGRVADFGCASGLLCRELDARGFRTTGLDIAAELIEVAKQNTPASIAYYSGDSSTLPALGQFDAVTSLMVLQFIEDLPRALSDIHESLIPGGRFLASVHNVGYVRETEGKHTLFSDFQNTSSPQTAVIHLGEERFVTYLRDEGGYVAECERHNLHHLWSWHSAPYADGTPPKYLVMAFERR